MLLLSGSAMADLQILSLPETTPNRVSLSIAAGEVIEFYGCSDVAGTGLPTPTYELDFAIGTSTTYHQIGTYPTLFVQAVPGPGTVRLWSNNVTSRGIVIYRIVPASNYAKNASPSGRFMAAAQPQRSGTPAIKETTASIADAVVTAAQPPLVALQK